MLLEEPTSGRQARFEARQLDLLEDAWGNQESEGRRPSWWANPFLDFLVPGHH